MRLEGKVAIITGGGAGIGRATVELFTREGAKVVIVEFNRETGQAALDAVRAAGGEAIFMPTDVSDEGQMQAMVDTALATYGWIDILHNNVGGSTSNDGPIHLVSNDEFWLKMRVGRVRHLAGVPEGDPAHDRTGRRGHRQHDLDQRHHRRAEPQRLCDGQGRDLVADAGAGGAVRR